MRLRFDEPSEEPPPGSYALLWMLAYRVHCDHAPADDGCCRAPSCERDSWPCQGHRLAQTGLVVAQVGYRRM